MAKKPTKTVLSKFLREQGFKVSRELKDDTEQMKGIIEQANLKDLFVNSYDILWDDDETPPAETPPAETPPAETPPTETPPAETPPAETPPAEIPPAETPPTETPPVETPPNNSIEERIKANIIEEQKQVIAPNSGAVTVLDTPVQKPKRKSKAKKNEIPSFIEGFVLLMILDIIVPSGLSMVFNMFTKDKTKKIDATDLSLDEMEEKKLLPMADKCAEHLQINASPVTTFFVVSLVMYGQKLFMLKSLKK